METQAVGLFEIVRRLGRWCELAQDLARIGVGQGHRPVPRSLLANPRSLCAGFSMSKPFNLRVELKRGQQKYTAVAFILATIPVSLDI